MAVVSQPGQRGARVPQPGPLDPSLGEFWVDSPWEIFRHGHNLSSFERNRVFLNVRGQNFVDISHLTGADSEGDGRSVVAGDFRNNGQLDLVVRQAGGGSLLFFENCFPRKHYLTVSLRGRESNRQGIGARLTATVAGRQLVRELYPHNSFRAQMPDQVHFGLRDDTRVDHLTIRWPSGQIQELTAVDADRHIIVDEGKQGSAAVQTVVPGRTLPP
jgi:enediyne biosynthesis protein E4